MEIWKNDGAAWSEAVVKCVEKRRAMETAWKEPKAAYHAATEDTEAITLLHQSTSYGLISALDKDKTKEET